MIRLRHTLECGSRHRWLAPLLILLVALLFVLVALHGTHDAAAQNGAICVGLVLMLIVVRFVARPTRNMVLTVAKVSRPPPHSKPESTRQFVRPLLVPLRL